MLLTRTYTGHPLGLIMALQDSEQWHHKSGRQYLLKLGVCHLRRNPPEVRVTSGQKPRTKIICIVLQLFCRALLNIFSKQFISSNTKHRKRMLNFVWNTWKFWWNVPWVPGEMKLMMKFCLCFHKITELWNFSRSRGKLFFGVISGNYLCI